MAWFPVDQSLIDHPKSLRAARRLGITQQALIGHLVTLWAWAMDYAPDGDLSHYEPEEIADAGRYTYPGLLDPDAETAFVRTLREAGGKTKCGFICRPGTRCEIGPGEIRLHDWAEWAGKWVEKRGQDAARKRLFRGGSEDSPMDVQRDGARRVDKSREDKKRKDQTPSALFERFWVAYPREGRRDKPKVRKAFDAAAKKTDPEEIIDAAGRYAADPNRGTAAHQTPTKYAQGWLSGERWNDPPLPAKSSRSSRHPTDAWLDQAAALGDGE